MPKTPRPFYFPAAASALGSMIPEIRAALDREIEHQARVHALRCWFQLNDDQARLILQDLAAAVALVARRTAISPADLAVSAWELWRQVAMQTMLVEPAGGIAAAQGAVEAWLATCERAGQVVAIDVWTDLQRGRR